MIKYMSSSYSRARSKKQYHFGGWPDASTDHIDRTNLNKIYAAVQQKESLLHASRPHRDHTAQYYVYLYV